MFRGRFEHALDAKGRLSVPVYFRELLATHYDERLIVTNFDGCLWAYPMAEWMEIEQKIAQLPQFKEEVKALQRVFVSGAAECPLDKAGRILLPPALRDYAGILREVTLVGATRRIELWARERWVVVFNGAQSALNDMGERLAGLGL
ncbi:MAG: division/cell wall cluster transcriptional repressor MraZ [Deltaproteobacteria bacterium]|nr:division/cell wall cluster transcriptional repressor MraZ [Deltaproteobacteria bacterium]